MAECNEFHGRTSQFPLFDYRISYFVTAVIITVVTMLRIQTRLINFYLVICLTTANFACFQGIFNSSNK